MITFKDLENDLNEICADFLELINSPGPSHAIARISENDPRIEEDFPMTRTIKGLVQKIREEDKINISMFEDHGNIVLVGGLKSMNPTESEIKDIPVVIGAHLDEITYLISNKTDRGLRELIPLCSPPRVEVSDTGIPFAHTEAKIFGFRKKNFVHLGDGRFSAERKKITDKRTSDTSYSDWKYLLKIEREIFKIEPGDVVIQDYGTNIKKENKQFSVDSEINAKALDDRVGSIVAICSLRYLAKSDPPIPIKVILTGDEEGVGEDVSWARLVIPTYRKYCNNDVVTLLCDGIDGHNLKEFEEKRKSQVLGEAILVPHTSHGKGAGDYGIFSLIKDYVIPIAQSKGKFQVLTSTDYVSRSFDPKIMDEFPLITFIDWSNGVVGRIESKCHSDEIIKIRQILNLIGMMVYSVHYLSKKIDPFY